MSEHVQSAPTPHSHPPALEEHERTPGVLHEREEFNFWLIVKVGIGLAVVGLLIHLLVGWLLGGLEKVNEQPVGAVSALAVEDANRPLGQRIDNVPTPHLEGIERDSSILVLRTEKGDDKRFYASVDVRVRIGDNDKARLFELNEGQRVTITYFMPSGVGGGIGVVTAVVTPPVASDKNADALALPDVARTFNGTIIKIEPRSIAAAREWTDVQKDRYGWTDREKGIVHVPIERAMDEVLKSKEFSSEKGKKKIAGRAVLPTRSSSGREVVGGGKQ